MAIKDSCTGCRFFLKKVRVLLHFSYQVSLKPVTIRFVAENAYILHRLKTGGETVLIFIVVRRFKGDLPFSINLK